MSPERLNPVQFGIKDSHPTKESDCYALGMVILEVLTGKVPFAQDNNNLMVTLKVLNGECPERPRGAPRMPYGKCCKRVGHPNQMTAQLPKLCSNV